MEEKNEQLNKEILSQIKEGKVEMKSHGYFLLRTILGVLGVFLLSLCLVFLFSFILFGLRKSGVALAPGFGPQGFILFAMSLPWMLILITVAFLAVLEILIRKYSFVYKKPILYSLLAVFGITTLITLLLPSFAIHNSVFRAYRPEIGGREMDMPPIGRFYRGFGMPHPPDLVRGVVVDFATGTLIISTDDGVTSSVIFSDLTKIFPGTKMRNGDELLIFGPRSTSGVIQAFGVREISD